jgi:cobalt/nickel transport system permease protein
MHIPDGFIDAGTSLGAGIVSAGGLSMAVKKAGSTLDDKQVPLAGLVAAFVFAAQMLNFPIGAGTSGHLLGGVLAAVLVGPWMGALCVSVVLVVQSLFADGGLTALGLNVFNMALVGAMGGYGMFVVVRRFLPPSKSGVTVASGIAAGLSVPLAAIAFVVEYAIGGTVGVSLGTVATAMVSVHSLIGIGEAVITAMTIGTVLGVRPDLVYGAGAMYLPVEIKRSSAPVTEA